MSANIKQRKETRANPTRNSILPKRWQGLSQYEQYGGPMFRPMLFFSVERDHSQTLAPTMMHFSTCGDARNSISTTPGASATLFWPGCVHSVAEKQAVGASVKTTEKAQTLIWGAYGSTLSHIRTGQSQPWDDLQTSCGCLKASQAKRKARKLASICFSLCCMCFAFFAAIHLANGHGANRFPGTTCQLYQTEFKAPYLSFAKIWLGYRNSICKHVHGPTDQMSGRKIHKVQCQTRQGHDSNNHCHTTTATVAAAAFVAEALASVPAVAQFVSVAS